MLRLRNLESIMASSYPILKSNVAGRFYVDESCIFCDLCIEIAPENFAFDSKEGAAFVMKQPDTDDECLHVRESLDLCPTDSIKDREPIRNQLTPTKNFLNDFGLGKGTTPTSIGGAFAQLIARWCARK